MCSTHASGGPDRGRRRLARRTLRAIAEVAVPPQGLRCGACRRRLRHGLQRGPGGGDRCRCGGRRRSCGRLPPHLHLQLPCQDSIESAAAGCSTDRARSSSFGAGSAAGGAVAGADRARRRRGGAGAAGAGGGSQLARRSSVGRARRRRCRLFGLARRDDHGRDASSGVVARPSLLVLHHYRQRRCDDQGCGDGQRHPPPGRPGSAPRIGGLLLERLRPRADGAPRGGADALVEPGGGSSRGVSRYARSRFGSRRSGSVTSAPVRAGMRAVSSARTAAGSSRSRD